MESNAALSFDTDHWNSLISKYSSNASYQRPSSDDIFGQSQNIFSTHSDFSTRPTTYNQLLDYLETLTVKVIDPADLTIGQCIGLGATFVVEDGRLANFNPSGMVVAVKTPRESIHKDSIVLNSIIQEVLDEIRVMSFFSLHPNVVTIIGVVLETSNDILLPRIVVEHAIGSLGHLLRASSGNEGVPLYLKLKFSLEIAAGLEALHLTDIVHGDVKSDNILIFYSTEHWGFFTPPALVAKVSDFGFCVPDISARDVYISRGTFGFKAPEASIESPPDLQQYANLPQRDIYSYGVTLWEIASDGLRPFDSLEKKNVVNLQLASDAGAADHLVATGVFASSKHDSRVLDVLTSVIKKTVCRYPQNRLQWQDVFEAICTISDGVPSPDPDWSLTEHFTRSDRRQRPISWNIFQSQGSWLPTIPFPTSTDDSAFSALVIRELQASSQKPSNWMSIIRLALHSFVRGDVSGMRNYLRVFRDNDVTIHDGHGSGLLHLATRLDAVEVMHALLSKGVAVDSLDISGLSPLHMVRSDAAAQTLVDFHANVNLSDPCSPLHMCQSGNIAKVLLANGAILEARDVYQATPLHTAETVDVASVLLQHGANPIAGDRTGGTPLHLASSDQLAMFLMKSHPYTVTTVDNNRRTPLHDGLTFWNGETVKLGVSLGADVNALSADGQSALFEGQHYISRPGRTNDVGAVKELISSGAVIPVPHSEHPEVESTPLHETISPAVLEYLLQHGCHHYINFRRRVPFTRNEVEAPLHVVAARDYALFQLWLTRRSREPRRRVMSFDVLTTAFDNGMSRLLPFLSRLPSSNLMMVLLNHGADPNIRDSNMDTPLHFVARNWIGYAGHLDNVDLITLLIQAGADINARNSFGETPLHCASRPETVLALLKAGANPNLVDNESVTILHNAFRFTDACEQIIDALVLHGAEVDARDNKGYTPLHYACRTYGQDSHGLVQLIRWNRSIQVHSGSVNLSLSLTPMFHNAVNLVTALLKNGADLNVRANSGATAIDLVSRQVFGRDVIRLLHSRGANLESLQPWWDFD
ncbi:hypothetical protein GGU11DRAFT_828569 [Lentinula aff. detonsa]|nr:hypothetical protein GGU11DRAFT_828569 [Lentinula aff. detonsa]